MAADDILKQAENDRTNRLERLDKQVNDARKQLENHTTDIETAKMQKKALLEEIADLENTVKSAVDSAFKNKQAELEEAKVEVVSSQKLITDANLKVQKTQEDLNKQLEEHQVKKIALEKSIKANQDETDKHVRIKTKFNALIKTIKDNLDVANE